MLIVILFRSVAGHFKPDHHFGFEAVSWYALMVPAATPGDVVDRLSAATVRFLASPETRAKLAAQGMDPGGGTPQELAATIRAESARWSEVVCKQNIKPE